MADITDDKKASSTSRIVGSDENFAVTVDSDENFHSEMHINAPDGTDKVFRSTGIVDSNSTSTPLLADASFIGSWFDAEQYSNLTVIVFSDEDSAVNGLLVEHSTDGVNIDDSDSYTISKISGPGGGNRQFSFPIPSRYFRINYTNGATNQSIFRLQSKVHTFTPKPSSHRVSDSISSENDTELVKSILTGRNPNNNFINLRLDGRSDGLSSNIPLGIDGVFTSPIVEVNGYLTLDFTVLSDQPSATNGIEIKWYSDEAGTNTLKTSNFDYTAINDGAFYNIPVQGSFAKLTYTNSGTAQTTFQLDTRFRTTPNIGLLSQIENTLTGDLLAVLARAVLFGRTEAGNLNNVALSNSDSLKVAITDRPSEVRDRTHVDAKIDNISLNNVGTVIHTVTPGKTFYLTSNLAFALNNANAVGSWVLRDGPNASGDKIPHLLPARNGSNPSSLSAASPALPEPIPFTTDIRAVEVLGDITLSITIVGYEE